MLREQRSAPNMMNVAVVAWIANVMGCWGISRTNRMLRHNQSFPHCLKPCCAFHDCIPSCWTCWTFCRVWEAGTPGGFLCQDSTSVKNFIFNLQKYLTITSHRLPCPSAYRLGFKMKEMTPSTRCCKLQDGSRGAWRGLVLTSQK